MRALLFSVLAGWTAASAVLAPVARARPLTPAEQRFHPYYAKIPRCDAEWITATVQSRFEQRESYYWKSGLAITRFDHVRETGFRSTGVDYIPRRYCEARAVINDGKTRAVYYTIGEDLDMTGVDAVRSLSQSLTFGLFPTLNADPYETWGVDWCVVGLDRNYAYANNCKAARP